MADFTHSKSYGTATYPVHALSVSNLLKRCEPLLTVAQLKSRFLKGIPLAFPNGDTFSDDDLKDQIFLASNEVELLLGTTLTREQRKEKHGFKNQDYRAFIHITAEWGPMQSIEELAIVSADGHNIFNIPCTWIETSQFTKRIINVIPLLASYGVNSVEGAQGNAGVAFLTVLGGLNWVPSYWQIKYTSGLADDKGQIPVPVNELVGVVAAINILSEIGPTWIYNSQSQTQDGISQSSSGLGPRIYEMRINDLRDRKDTLEKKLKALFNNKFFVGNF